MISKWFIYKITSPSGRVYIGRTNNVKRRVNFYKFSKRNHGIISKSISKYGFDAHTFEVIDEFIGDINFAHGKEIFWIRSFMSNKSAYPNINGLNLTNGGDGMLGHYVTEETRNKIGKSLLGKKLSEEHKAKLKANHRGMTGKKRSKEHIEFLRKRQLGKIHTPEQRANMSKAHIGIVAWWRHKSVVQYSGDKIIAEYKTIQEASEKIGCLRTSICNNLSGLTKSCAGYNFKYKEVVSVN